MLTIFNAEISIIAVILGAISAMVVGMLWYGPLMGKEWMKLTGKTAADTQAKPMDYIPNVITALVSAFVMNHIISWFVASSALYAIAGQEGILTGEWNVFIAAIFAAIVSWAAFTLPAYVNEMVWEGRRRKLMALNAAHQLVTFLVMALVIALVLELS